MSAEPVILSNEDKLYLKSIRVKPFTSSHADQIQLASTSNMPASTSNMPASVIYGHVYYDPVQKRAVDYLRQNYVTQPNDVFITSYPRSGTHWIMKICMEIMRHGAYNSTSLPPEYQNADYRFIPQFEPMVSQINGIKILQTFIDRYNIKYPSLRFNFSHCPWRYFPAKQINRKTKIIHIVRNPKDTLVSNYHIGHDLKKTFGKEGSKQTIESLDKQYSDWDIGFESFMTGFVVGGDWWSNLIEWYLASKNNNNNILFLYYEDIKENPTQQIGRICRFLCKDEGDKYLNVSLLNDDNVLDKIVKQCTFSKQKESAKRGWKFVARKGIIGDWKNYFSDQQSKIMDNKTRIMFHRMNDIRYYNIMSKL
eukprot:241627_1